MEDNDDPNQAHSTNITQDEIDQDTVQKLRGDAIGDTMYSEVFVLNTLMKFSDLKWNSELENDLCFLWDMTEEIDVSTYLYKVGYPALACTAITSYTEPRFVEIVVGIFANLLCSKCEYVLKEEEVKTVIGLLESNDPYILNQVMRFIHAAVFKFDKLDWIERGHLDRFNFILSNSTNKELLVGTLKTLSSITDDNKIGADIITGQLLMSTITAYKTLKESENELFETQEQHLNIKHLIQIVCNLCSYIDNFSLDQLKEEFKTNLGVLTDEIDLLLCFYTSEDFLIPLNDDFKFYIQALSYVYRTLGIGFISSFIKPLYDIYLIVSEKEPSNLEKIAELLCYFISVASIESVKNNFDTISLDDFKRILLDIESRALSYDFDYLENLRRIVSDL